MPLAILAAPQECSAPPGCLVCSRLPTDASCWAFCTNAQERGIRSLQAGRAARGFVLQNVSLVLAHLDGAHSEPPTAFLCRNERQELRQALLGPAAEAWSRDGPGPQPAGRA
eukprot:155299-Alexandrium_andersonii.AAC.1